MRYLLCIFFALLALGCGDPKAGGVDSHSHQGGQAGESEHAHDGEHGEQDHEREQGEHEEGFVTLTEAQRKEVGLETSVPQEARAQSAPRTGRVEADPDRRVIVSPQVEGTVKHLPIIIGSQVHRGDTLAVLDSPEIVELMGEYHNAQVEVDLASKELRNTESLLSLGDESRREVEEAELQLAEATARRDAVQARLESARLAHERLRTLRAEGIASSQQVEEALANRSALEAELRQASTAITIARQHLERERRVSGSQLRRKAETFPAEATLARARENLKHLEERLLQLGASLEEDGGVILTSPIDGQVIARPVTRGQMVKAGDTVAELVDPSQVWVIIDLVRADLGSVKVGDEVTVTLVHDPGARAVGSISHIDPQVEAESQTVRARVELREPGGKFRVGSFVNATLAGGDGRYPVVPEQAVVEVEGQKVVYRADGEGYRRTPIEVVAEGAGMASISGLPEGARVVTKGASDLKSLDLAGSIGGHHH